MPKMPIPYMESWFPPRLCFMRRVISVIHSYSYITVIASASQLKVCFTLCWLQKHCVYDFVSPDWKPIKWQNFFKVISVNNLIKFIKPYILIYIFWNIYWYVCIYWYIYFEILDVTLWVCQVLLKTDLYFRI